MLIDYFRSQKEADLLEVQKTELQNAVDELRVKVEDQTDKVASVKL
jgi:hypothetical protein